MSCPAGYTFDTTPRVAPFAAATETYKPGQRVPYSSGDIVWTENHLPASKLKTLRSLGDPLADDALAALGIKRGEDALKALLAYTAQPLNEQRNPAPQQLLAQVMTVPDWVDWDRVQRGQQVYWYVVSHRQKLCFVICFHYFSHLSSFLHSTRQALLPLYKHHARPFLSCQWVLCIESDEGHELYWLFFERKG